MCNNIIQFDGTSKTIDNNLANYVFLDLSRSIKCWIRKFI